MVTRPRIGLSTEHERGVELERVRAKQRSIERGQRLIELEREFDREGIVFRSSLPVGASEDEVIRNLEGQLARRRQQRVNRPNFDAVQSQGSAPLGRKIEASLFGLTAPIAPLLTAAGLAGGTAGAAAAGLVVNPRETVQEVRDRGGSIFNPVDIAGAASKTTPGPAFAGEIAGGILTGKLVSGGGVVGAAGAGAAAVQGTRRVAGATPGAVASGVKATARQFRPPKNPGLIGDDPVARPIIDKLTKVLSEAKPLREAVEIRRNIVRSEQARNIAATQADRSLLPGQAVVRSRAITKGELPFGEFDLGEEALSAADLISLRNTIRFSGDLKPFDKTNLDQSLLRVLGAVDEEGGSITSITGRGRLPSRGEIDKLGEFFGDDFSRELLKKRSLGSKLYDEVISGINLPRTMLASFGIDALRQGAPLIAAHPRSSFRAFNMAWRAARSDEVAREIINGLRRDGDVAILEANGLELTAFGRSAAATAREEAFISRWGQIFPWVRVSERANSTFFNVLRAEIGKGILTEWREADAIAGLSGSASRNLTNQNVKALANFINIASGRGNLGPLQRHSPVLNAVFFSPRLITSRFQLPFTALTRSPAVRKQIVRDMSIFAATNIGILAFLKAAGGDKVDVELDPRSSDFGQLKIGPQRVDFWGGLRQIAVLAARVGTGETKSTGTETILPQDAKDSIIQFFRFKLSPQAAVVTDFVTEETALGEELGVDNQVFDRLLPLVIEDMKEAFEAQGIGGAAISSFSLVGLNSNTFLTTQDIINPLLETSIDVQAQDGSGRITDITDSRLTPGQRSQILARQDVQQALQAQGRRTKQDQLQVERNALRNRRIASDTMLTRGEVDGRVWRNQLLTARLVNAAASETREALQGAAPSFRPRNDNERALKAYFDLVEMHRISSEEINVAGADLQSLSPEERGLIARGFDVDGFSTAVDQFLGNLPAEQRQFVLDNIHADRTPVENLYYEAQEILRDYWNVPDEVITDPQVRAEYDQWLSMAPNARREFERGRRVLQRDIKRIAVQRERMRKRDRRIDDMLIAFYSGAATHRSNVRESRAGLQLSETRRRIFSDVDERLSAKFGIQ